MKAVLLHVYGDEGQKARLDTAVALVRAFGGQLQCIQVSPMSSYVITEPFGGMYMVAQLYEMLEKQAREEKAKIDLELKNAGVLFEWIGIDGGIARSIIDWSRLSDLVVLSKADYRPGHDNRPAPIWADVAIGARSPVLAVPQCYAKTFDPAGHALIAWNGSPEGANALRAVLPMLKLATAVTIVAIGDGDEDFPPSRAAAYLALHGIASKVHAVSAGNEAVSDILMQTAQSLSATYVVMGAYGHSRFREAVFGGVTRMMLERSDVPLLMAH
jgi:nucleotide-binding universal stress UspA family protein